VVSALQSVGRCDDFISVLQSISNGKLDIRNLALRLLLDVGKFLNCNQMRYSQTSIYFWLLIQKLFKGKVLCFFRGPRYFQILTKAPQLAIVVSTTELDMMINKWIDVSLNTVKPLHNGHLDTDCLDMKQSV
jgi:hypothetical protein